MSFNQSTCSFCKLPLPEGFWDKSEHAKSENLFCCLGCRFASAVTQEQGDTGATRWRLTSLGISIFFTMNVMVFTLVLWQYNIYPEQTHDPFIETLSELFRYICLLLALPVLFLLGKPLLENALSSLYRGFFSTDLLLLSGVLAAYIYSTISVFSEQGAIYFEVGCMILVMVTLGRWLEATGRLRATSKLDQLEQLLPQTVRRLEHQSEEVISIDDVHPGDILLVQPGERIPVDGRLLSDYAVVDEQILTGESWPVEKQTNEKLLGGALNQNLQIKMQVSTCSQAGTLSRMIAAVRDARLSKGKYEQLADNCSRWFFPIVTCIMLGVLSFYTWQESFEQGMLCALAVVLIACPCALGIATPLAVWAALGRAAEAQVLFRNGETLEQLARVRAVRFDKTGTLTTGKVNVSQWICHAQEDNHLLLEQVCLITAAVSHPFSQAISQFAHTILESESLYSSKYTTMKWKQLQNIPGKGIAAISEQGDDSFWLGSLRLMKEQKLEIPLAMQESIEQAYADGLPMSLLGWQGKVCGLFLFEEELRPDTKNVINWCQSSGIDIALLTGDHSQRGARLANELNIPVISELLPDQKVEHIEHARQQFGTVAMVGDGMNDAPALTAADIGLAMGCGADLSRDSANVCLLGNDLTRVIWSIQLARLTVQTIKRNLCWAISYNSLGILLAALGYLNPIFAALLMIGSSLLVISSSLRLKYVTIPEQIISQKTEAGLQKMNIQQLKLNLQQDNFSHPQPIEAKT